MVAVCDKAVRGTVRAGGGMKNPRAIALAGGAASLALVLTLGVGAGGSGAASTKALTQAKGELLKKADMPKGWTSTGTASSGSGSLPNEDQLASCIGVPLSTLSVNPPNVNSPQFSSKDQIRSVSSSISLFSSAKPARAQYAAIASAKAPGCLSDVFNGPAKAQLNSGFGHGLTAGNIAVTRLPGSYAPKGSTAIALNFTVTGTGISAKGEIIFIFAVKGSKGMELSLTSVQTAFPASMSKHLSTLQLSRL
jgi:hypothetical protein